MRRVSKQLKLRPLIIFYILLVYIFASLVWWTYLLLSNNRTSFHHAESAMLSEYSGLGREIVLGSEPYHHLKQRYWRQRVMIIGESSIFLVLLVLGALRIRGSYLHELDLSRQQRNFLLSVTHELKSPLSSIRLGLETLLTKNLDQESRERLLSNSLEDTERLQSLVEDILMAARFEDEEGYTFTMEPFDLSEAVNEVSRSHIDRAGNSHVLRTDVTPGIVAHGDHAALCIAIGNIVDNAIRYSSQGTMIEVKLEQRNTRACVIVSDQGPGIPHRERRKIFRRFYRIGSEDTRKSKGTGLGLFIVKQIVERHGGKVRVSDSEGKGSQFEVTLPVTE